MTISGCDTITSIDHLCAECRLLSVKEHSVLLSRQFLLGVHLRSRPDNHTTLPLPRHPPGLRPTLLAKFGSDITKFIPNSG